MVVKLLSWVERERGEGEEKEMALRKWRFRDFEGCLGGRILLEGGSVDGGIDDVPDRRCF